MNGVIQSFLSIILSVECIIGNLGNGFIALVNCTDWVRTTKMSSVDRILTALAVSRIVLLWLTFIDWWVTVLNPAMWMSENMSKMICISWTVANHFGIWLATCLSIFYFLKIANYSNSIFLYLKWRVTKVVSVTGMMSLVLLFLEVLLMNIYDNVFAEYQRNMSYTSNLTISVHCNNHPLFTHILYMLVPFAVSVTTFLLLIFSLGKHLKRMQCSARGSRDAGTTAHMKALRTMVISLLMYTSFFSSFLVQVHNPKNQIFSAFLEAVIIAFLLVHSFVLILGSSKLRQAFLLALRWLRCRARDVELSNPQTLSGIILHVLEENQITHYPGC
ncbi:taste receptor type 2 member 140-like [Fukomys damarensis]|uniref:taste receptor type 2 member 140-like n=1 Tax=Fukomys damarensis TaxID=885580 RepID=UPI00053F6313|nr:taste receptor type 2 member 140-like [Fukomys damarensis]